jgi:YD repeat-containing protein
MKTSPSRLVLFALISAAIGLIGTAGSRAEVVPNPPGIAMSVNRQPIAHPITEGVPVVTPLTRRPKGSSDAGSKPTPSVATAPGPGLALPSAGAQSAGCATAGSQPAPLVALASSLKCDPDLIFEFVYNNIEFEPLYGSNKGPLGTLLDRRGDDADQAILFVTLLNIAGYSQTGYANVLLLTSGDEIANLLGVTNDAVAIENLLSLGGILYGAATVNPDGTLAFIEILHFWAALQLNGSWYYFDPSFKQHTILSGISNLATALGYSRSQFLSDAGGTINSVSISNINRANLRADLVSYATNLINTINQNNRTWSVGNVIGGKLIQPLQGSPIRVQDSSITPSSAFPATCPNQSPTPECRTFVTITMPGASSSQAIKLYTDQIYGHRITVFSTPSGANFVPTLLIDGAPPSCVAAGTCTNIGPPTAGGVTWSIPTQIVEPNQPSTAACGTGITACKTLTVASGSSYLIGVGTGRVGRGMADYHRQLLTQARAAGNADTTELVLGESLAAISYSWLAQVSAAQNILDHLAQVTTLYNFAAGITGQANIQQSGFQGPHVDLPVNYVNVAVQSSTGPTTIVGGISYPTAFLSAGAALSQVTSSFESAVLEQTQAPVAGMTAASTIKIIDSNMNPGYSGSLGTTFFADGTTAAGQSAYTTNILPAINSHYGSTDLTDISNAVSSGYQVLIPQNGTLSVGLWNGAGYTETLPQTGQLTITQKISGGMSGGFSGTDVEDPPENTEETLPTAANSDTADPILNTIPAPSNPPVVEPVDGITGAYVYKTTDLTTGCGRFPYALNFARTYLSSSGSSLTTTNSDTGIGNGWAHNWSSNVQIQSDPYLGIGVDGSPAVSAATSIAALYVMQDLMSVTPGAQTATISSMVARWFTDQLTGNTAIVSQPDTTEEFIALPHADGSTGIAYNPPPGSSARVNQIASGQFSYVRKNGVTSNFGPTPVGVLQSIVFPNGVTINLSYSGSPLLLSQIANNLGRSLNLAYSGTNISSVTDDSGRSVAYAYDGSSNLTSFTDPLANQTTYAYDTTGAYDAAGHLTQIFYPNAPATPFVTNYYDGLGRVVKQANAAGPITNLYFAGSRTEIVDPLLNRHVTYQTDRGRVLSDAYVLSSGFGDVFNDTAQQNGIVNVTQHQYDGLDRLTATMFPEAGSVAYSYAASPNPWANNISSVTKTAKPGSSLAPLTTTYTYDPIFNKPTGITDPLGLVTNMSYDATTGNLVSMVSDAGGAGHFNATSSFSYNVVG